MTSRPAGGAPARRAEDVDSPIAWEPSLAFLRYAIWFILAGSAAYIVGLRILVPTQTTRALVVLSLLVVSGAAWFLLARGRAQAAVQTLTIGLWTYVTVTSLVVGGVSAVAVIIYPLIILLVGWLVGTRMAVAIAVATAVATLAFAILESLRLLPPPLPTPPILRWVVQCGVFLLSAVLIAHVVRSHRNSLADQRKLGRDLAQRTRDLEAREADLNRAQAVAHIGSWEYELAADTMHLSAEACRIFGVPAGTRGSHDTYLTRVHLEDRGPLDDAWQAALRGGVRFEHEHRILVDESIRWVRQIAELERDAEGRPLRSVGTTEDITERKRTEQSLRESEAQLECILGSTADGLLAVTQQGRVIRTNQRFALLWRIPQSLLDHGDDQALLAYVVDQLSDPDAFLRRVQELYQSDAEFTDTIGFKDGRVFERFTAPLLLNGSNIGRVWSFRDITERRQAETALVESRNLLQAIIDTAPVRVFWKDRNLRYLGCNPAFAKDAGKTAPEEVIGKDDCQLGWLDHADLYRSDDLAVLESGAARLAYDEPQTTPGGQHVWLRTSKVPLRSRDDQLMGILGIYEDITERKRVEQRLSMAIEVTRVVLWELDFVNDRLLFDPGRLPMLGVVVEEAPHSLRSWLELVHPDDRAMFQERVEQTLSSSDPVFDFEYRLAASAVASEWVHTRGRVVERGEGGQPLLAVGTTVNITARKQIEEAMRTSEQRFRSLASMLRLMCDNVPDMIWAKDLDGRFVFANKATCERLLNATDTAEPLGKTDAFFVQRERASHPDDPEWHTFGELSRVGMEMAVIDGRASVLEECGNVKGKRLFLDVQSAPFIDEHGHVIGTVGAARDVTERKRVEAERAALEAQLQQAQKMESVGRLAGGVAHDFNNMLSVILGHAELALLEADPTQSLHADLEEIRRTATRSADLTRQLLAFARKQRIAPTVLDLNATVAVMLTMLQRLIGENIHILWKPAADLWPVKMDPSQLDQILTNLCVNARDAISGSGHLTIETSNRNMDDAYCARHVGMVPGDYVRLAVRDDGCGMDEDTLARLFEPFFTTKEFGQGAGLGLASVYGAVKQNGGFIDVDSAPGRGTTFTIYLHRHAGGAEQPRKEGAVAPLLHGHETILLVEDESAILAMATAMLERQGYTVLAAATPGEALQLARAHRGQIHLLMTDVVMPRMNGAELASYVVALYPDLKRLFMSGYPSDIIAHHGVGQGSDFIQKPFAMRDLAAKIRDVLDQKQG